jgi:hypothetical protein
MVNARADARSSSQLLASSGTNRHMMDGWCRNVGREPFGIGKTSKPEISAGHHLQYVPSL